LQQAIFHIVGLEDMYFGEKLFLFLPSFVFMKVKFLTATLLSIYLFTNLYGIKTPTVIWQKSLGGNNVESAYRLFELKDGGYLISGESKSGISGDKTTESMSSQTNFWILKLNKNGDVVWQKTFNNASNYKTYSNGDYSNKCFIDCNSSYWIIGGDFPVRGDKDRDYWYELYDHNCQLIRKDTIKTSNYRNELLISIKLVYTQNFVVLSKYYEDNNLFMTDPKYMIAVFDNTGAIEKYKNFNFGERIVHELSFYNCCSYYLTMTNQEVGRQKGDDFEIRGLNSLLVHEPASPLGTFGGDKTDALEMITQNYFGGFILGGSSNSNISYDKSEDSKGKMDIWVLKTDFRGTKYWDKTLGGEGDDLISVVRETMDKGLIIGGSSDSNISGDKTEKSLGGFDFWIIKLNKSGKILWQMTIGGENMDVLSDIIETKDGYVLLGSSFSDISGNKTAANKGDSDYWVIKLKK
jgi:hypothetical protein